MSSITIVRRIAARPAIVFEALATAGGVAAWWGPDDVPVIAAEVDARVGGAYRIRFQTADGAVHEAFGEFLEVDPPRRLAMSWAYAVGGEPEEGVRTSRVAFELKALDGGTELTLTHSDLINEASAVSHRGGWTGALDKLVRQMADRNTQQG